MFKADEGCVWGGWWGEEGCGEMSVGKIIDMGKYLSIEYDFIIILFSFSNNFLRISWLIYAGFIS